MCLMSQGYRRQSWESELFLQAQSHGEVLWVKEPYEAQLGWALGKQGPPAFSVFHPQNP